MWMQQSICSPTQERLGLNDKNNRGETIEDFSKASKVTLEHIFNNHDNFSAEWYFNTREP